MPVALVTVVPTKTNLGLANAKGEVCFTLSGDLAECCRELAKDLPNATPDTLVGGSTFVLTYVDALDLVREVFGLAAGFSRLQPYAAAVCGLRDVCSPV